MVVVSNLWFMYPIKTPGAKDYSECNPTRNVNLGRFVNVVIIVNVKCCEGFEKNFVTILGGSQAWTFRWKCHVALLNYWICQPIHICLVFLHFCFGKIKTTKTDEIVNDNNPKLYMSLGSFLFELQSLCSAMNSIHVSHPDYQPTQSCLQITYFLTSLPLPPMSKSPFSLALRNNNWMINLNLYLFCSSSNVFFYFTTIFFHIIYSGHSLSSPNSSQIFWPLLPTQLHKLSFFLSSGKQTKNLPE